MTVMNYHTTQQLLKLSKSQRNARLARRIQAIAMAKQGYSCSQISQITGRAYLLGSHAQLIVVA